MKLSFKKILEYTTPGPRTVVYPDDLEDKSDLDWENKEEKEELMNNEELSIINLYESITEKNKMGKMVALYTPKHIGEKLQSAFESEEGDRVEPKDMHITIGLVRSDDDDEVVEALKKTSQELSPVKVDIDSFDIFEPSNSTEGRYVLHAKPKSKELNKLHKIVMSRLKEHGVEIDNGDFEWNPHITIKYCKNRPKIENKKVNGSINFDRVYFSSADNHHPILLNKWV